MNLRALSGVALGALAFLATSEALGFCRATTCDPADPTEVCRRNATTECLLSGEPVYWASNCITLSVQADGAPRSGISYEEAEASLKRAVAAWTGAKCRRGRPSIEVQVSGPVSCAASEYSSDHHNANILIFREDFWPYEGSEDALGYTRLRFDLEETPGAMWDADIEINAVVERFSTGAPAANEVDLDSVLTHEVGHLLGLGHTLDEAATMAAGYTRGTTGVRTLAADDIAGICDIYPPDRNAASSTCEPRHGFSELCSRDQPTEDLPRDGGCSLVKAPRASNELTLLDALSWLTCLALLPGAQRRLGRRAGRRGLR